MTPTAAPCGEQTKTLVVIFSRWRRATLFFSEILILLGAFAQASGQTDFLAFALVDSPPIDGIVDSVTGPSLLIGEIKDLGPQIGGLVRTRLNVQLPAPPPHGRLLQATLTLYLLHNSGITGNPSFGPVSLYHDFRPNTFGFSDKDYADTNFVLVSSSVVTPTSPTGRYYDFDVTAQIAKDYAYDGATPYSDFRLQVDGLQFLDSSHDYEFAAPYSVYPPMLIVQFVPKLSIAVESPSTLSLSWPTNYSEYFVETIQSIDATNWTALTNESTITNAVFRTTIDSTGPGKFFRLHKH